MRSSSFPRVVAAVGVALICVAVLANQSWLDRHFLPSFFVPRRWYVWIESIVRICIAAIGVMLVFARGWVARLLTHAPALTLQVVVAAALAVGAGEYAVRWIHLRPTGWLHAQAEPLRQKDPYLGWVLVPKRASRATVGNRVVDYATDPDGYRVRRVDAPVDRERPTIVFGGESVMFGEGLTWEESIPAQVEARLGVQSANLAVHGYSTDQIYLRLARELPRFQRPVAVVTIFMTELVGRNLDDDRPHLGPGLAWLPAQRQPRLLAMATWLVPFRRVSTVDRGIEITREALDAIVRLARVRGATPLVVVPQLGAEDGELRALRERVLKSDLPTVLVPLAGEWRLPGNLHPNAHAAEVIAAAIAARLGTGVPSHPPAGSDNAGDINGGVRLSMLTGEMNARLRYSGLHLLLQEMACGISGRRSSSRWSSRRRWEGRHPARSR